MHDKNKIDKIPKNKPNKKSLRLLWQKLCIFNDGQAKKIQLMVK